MQARFWMVSVLLLAATLLAIGAWFSTAALAQDTEPCEDGTAVTSPADNSELVADCEVLLALKDELRGTTALNWSADRVITSWDGVTVNRGFVLVGAPLRVAKLVLRNENLNGSLPPGLGQLTGLYEVDLRGNQLTGPIPSEWGTLTKMLYLYLQDNELSGPIPPELGQLANLRQLALTDNQLSGLIPPVLGRLSQLRSLNLDDNQLSGRIPSQLGGLTRLTTISLDGNQLTGCLPPRLRSVASNDYTELGLADCPATATLTLTAGANGNTTPAAGTHSYAYGTSVTVTATPDTDYRIASWSGACEGVGTEATCTLVMDLNLTAGVTFERDRQTLTTWSGANGSISPAAGEHQYDHGSSVTVTATPDTGYEVEAWGGDCLDSGTSTTCTLTMDASKTARVVFAPSGTVCATATDASCLIAVYKGAHDEYASIADIPDEKRLSPNTAGQYVVDRGEQVTVVTRTTVPTGYTRLYLQRSPQERPYPAVAERLIPPEGTTYTFTVSTDESAARLITYDLTAARPRPLPRPGQKPELGDVEVKTVFKVKPPPLGLALTSSRELCTAGTLTELSWAISGGEPPYTLTIEGETVDAAAESHRVNCGPIATDPLTHDPIANPTKAFTAAVSDSQATPATSAAKTQVSLAPALPASTEVWASVHPGFVYSNWDRVAGTGSQYPEVDLSRLDPSEGRDKYGLEGYFIRYRTDEAPEWTYAVHSDGEMTTLAGYLRPWETPPPGTFYNMSLAAGRHPLELETPEALNWSAPIRYTTSGPAQNLIMTPTHNSVTVTWSKQPGTGSARAYLNAPKWGGADRWVSEGEEPGTHTVVFNHLEPDTDYQVTILRAPREGRGAVTRSFRTQPPPPDWTPLPRGPQNLRATATHDTITVTWDPPYEGASPIWSASMTIGDLMVHTFDTKKGVTTWVSSGIVDSIGRYRIRPATTYRISVSHIDVVRAPQTIMVTTQKLPRESSARGSSDDEPDYEHPRLPFAIDWPLRVDSRHYLVADPWEWRRYRFHVGMDPGGFQSHSIPEGDGGREVLTVAAGTLRIFNDNPGNVNYVHYCPHLPGPLADQVIVDRRMEIEDSSTGETLCNYLASPASGRTALVFHDDKHVSKYAHLAPDSFAIQQEIAGTGSTSLAALLDKDEDGHIDSSDSVSIPRGTVIGLVGRSGRPDAVYVAPEGCPLLDYDRAYCPHLHFELLLLEGEVGANWFREGGARDCSGDEIQYGVRGYCGWTPDRRMPPLLDPERYLEPLPASHVPRDPGYGTAIRKANSNRRVFELSSVSPSGTGDGVIATLSTASWRPAFYSRYNVYGRHHLSSVAGTRPGVEQYYTIDSCTPGLGQTRLPTAAPEGEHPGEFARLEQRVPLSINHQCTVHLYTANPSYPVSIRAIGLVSHLSREHITLDDPTTTLSLRAILDIGNSLYTNVERLVGDTHDIFTFRAVPGQTYRFCVTGGTSSTACINESSGDRVAELLLVGPAAEGQSGVVTSGLTRGASGLSWTVPATPAEVKTYAVVVRRRARYEGGEVADHRYRLKYTVPDVPICDPSDPNDPLVLYCDPPAPVISGTSNISATGFTVNFSSSHRATSYQAMLTVDGVSKVVGVESIDLEADSQSHPFTDLMPNKLHQVQVRALNATGPSAWSTSHPVRTLELPFCIGPLGGAAGSQRDDAQSQECKVLDPPITEEPSEITNGSAKLSWTAKGDDLLFELHKVIGTDCDNLLPTDLSQLDTTSERFFVFRGLTANTAYRLCVRATLMVGEGDDAVIVRSAWAWEPATTLNRPARPPDKQRNLETPTDETEWRVPKDNSTACEWAEYTVQPQRNRAVWSTERQAWLFEDDGWVDDGEATTTWERTTKACVPNPGPLSRDLETATGMTEWRVPKDNSTACEWAEYTVQPQTNPGNWSSTAEAWQFPESGWVDDGEATTTWKRTKKECVSNPGPRNRNLENPTGMTEWRVPANIACEWAEYTVQPQTNPGTWSSAAEAWQFPESGWVDDGDASTTWKRTTRACKTKPADDVVYVEQYQRQSETRWVAIDDGIFCLEEEEIRYRYKGAYFLRPHVWSDSEEAWVDGTQNASPFFVDPVFGDWTGWSKTDNTRPCAASSDERAEGGQASGAIKPAKLTAGDYRLQWGEHWLRFTVPEGTFVTLRGRTLDSGVHAAVFEVAGGAELVVDPGQLSVTEPPPTTLTRGVSDPTLTAFAASLRLSPEQPAEELPHREQECRELIGNASTAAPIDLGVSGCTVARGGGRFTVSLAETQLTVSLPSGRDWLLAVSGTADSTPALALVEMQSGGYVLLSIVTGAELERQIPATSTGLDAVLDAISASPVTSDGG